MMLNAPINRWLTVAAGAVGNGLGAGIFIIYVLSGLIKPMVADLGFDRSVISFSLTCFLATSAIGVVSLGILIHRYGVRRPTFAYLALTAIGVGLIPVLPATPLAFYLLFAILGVAAAAATALPYAVAITGLFDHRRGLALALAVAGGGFGGMIGPLLTNLLLHHFGWRGAFAIVAGIMALPLITLVLFVRSPPAITGRDPVVDAGGFAAHWSLYLSKRAFWLLAPVILAIPAAAFILGILVPLLTDRGVAAADAAFVLSLAGTASLFARIGVGWLLDRFWAPMIAALVCVGAVVGLLLVGYSHTTLVAALGAGLLGTAIGAEGDLLTYLSSRYFSLQAFSRVAGSLWVAWAWGGGIGTIAAGIAYRATGSYQPALLMMAALLLVGAACVLLLGPYAYPPAHAAREDAVPAKAG